MLEVYCSRWEQHLHWGHCLHWYGGWSIRDKSFVQTHLSVTVLVATKEGASWYYVPPRLFLFDWIIILPPSLAKHEYAGSTNLNLAEGHTEEPIPQWKNIFRWEDGIPRLCRVCPRCHHLVVQMLFLIKKGREGQHKTKYISDPWEEQWSVLFCSTTILYHITRKMPTYWLVSINTAIDRCWWWICGGKFTDTARKQIITIELSICRNSLILIVFVDWIYSKCSSNFCFLGD